MSPFLSPSSTRFNTRASPVRLPRPSDAEKENVFINFPSRADYAQLEPPRPSEGWLKNPSWIGLFSLMLILTN